MSRIVMRSQTEVMVELPPGGKGEPPPKDNGRQSPKDPPMRNNCRKGHKRELELDRPNYPVKNLGPRQTPQCLEN